MNLPADFITLMSAQMNADEFKSLEQALETDRITSIRFNRFKDMPAEHRYAGDIIPWCSDGMYLQQRPSFTLDPFFHAGCYYVQEASSMFVSHLLEQYMPKEPVVALDLCAAPGGKSTLLSSLLPEGSFLIANEPIRPRTHILRENLIKWGAPNTMVTANFAADFQPMGSVFDIILCDAPCSGEGMFRKDEDALKEWSMENVLNCQSRQREIVSDIWPTLKPGGVLIYSTCTFNNLENEENISWFCNELGAEVLPLNAPEEWGISNGHFFPHRTKGEGFFVSVLRKSPDAEVYSVKAKKDKKKEGKSVSGTQKCNTDLSQWLACPSDFKIVKTDETTFAAIPTEYANLYSKAKTNLRIVHAGIELGTIVNERKGTIEPSQSLAMSTALAADAFPSAELTLDDALSYLRRETVPLSPPLPTGYILMRYEGTPLGFMKNIGNRANNLYPSEWRIRH